MTVIENLDFDGGQWESFADLERFERIHPRRDGLMPVGRDRARRRSHSRAQARPGRRTGWVKSAS